MTKMAGEIYKMICREVSDGMARQIVKMLKM